MASSDAEKADPANGHTKLASQNVPLGVGDERDIVGAAFHE